MKILYGITKSNWGGAQRYVYDLAVSAKNAGHDVSVLAGGNGVLIEKLNTAGIRVIPIPYMARDIKIKGEIKGFFDIYAILRREKPDVFHINSSKMGGLGALAARLARIKKIIFTGHGWAFNEPRHWFQKLIIEELVWLTIMLSHKTICVSEGTKRDVENKPFLRSKLLVVHNGIEEFQVPPKTKNEHLVIGTIAELHKIKGLDIALRGFARAFKYTDVTFEIIGGGEEKKELEGLVKELGIGSQVLFHGFKENARELLSRFDIFTVTSRSEAFCFVLLEASMAHLPAIATKVGGIPEIIKDGETGILIPKENVQALADALKRLAASEDERKRLGDNLHAFVKKEFSKSKMIEKTLKTYS